MFPADHVSRFHALIEACASGKACLVECVDDKTGEVATILCEVDKKDDMVFLRPLAKVLGDSAKDQYSPRVDEFKRVAITHTMDELLTPVSTSETTLN